MLADRKFVGETGGTILVNGTQRDDTVFRRIVGYVQQMDAHIATATVRESLMFSAKLRLPSSYTDAQINAEVDQVRHSRSL